MEDWSPASPHANRSTFPFREPEPGPPEKKPGAILRAGRNEAIPLLEEASRASKKHPTLRWVGEQLLDAYAKAGQPAAAMKLIDDLLAGARKSLPKDSSQLAGDLASFGLSRLEIKGFTVAEPLLHECLAIREKTQPDAWTTFNTQTQLGGALLGQKRYADAERAKYPTPTETAPNQDKAATPPTDGK